MAHQAQQVIATYNIFAPNYSVTGIRSENANNTQVVMTGTCPSGRTQAMLYRGPMNPQDSSGCHCLTPIFSNDEILVSSIFYGPNTAFFDPKIKPGHVRAVGTYNYTDDPSTQNFGMLYEGPLDGPNQQQYWTRIDIPDGVAGGKVDNTIPHSTMGDLIVGNYERVGQPRGLFGAFICRMGPTFAYRQLRLKLDGRLIELVTAYGIWQNNSGGASIPPYTIAGGCKPHNDPSELNVGFLVDYDWDKDTTSHERTFRYDNAPSEITHFEGITQCGSNCYSLAATGDQGQDTDNRGAAFAVVKRNPDGLFSDAAWQRVDNSASTGITTGNTVLTNNVFGVYTTGSGIQSYLVSNLPVAFNCS